MACFSFILCWHLPERKTIFWTYCCFDASFSWLLKGASSFLCSHLRHPRRWRKTLKSNCWPRHHLTSSRVSSSGSYPGGCWSAHCSWNSISYRSWSDWSWIHDGCFHCPPRVCGVSMRFTWLWSSILIDGSIFGLSSLVSCQWLRNSWPTLIHTARPHLYTPISYAFMGSILRR